jgi:hypothetical protein
VLPALLLRSCATKAVRNQFRKKGVFGCLSSFKYFTDCSDTSEGAIRIEKFVQLIGAKRDDTQHVFLCLEYSRDVIFVSAGYLVGIFQK